ncbi:SPOR domain-containing protein [Novosphingobium aquimarinum]|uniref:SPOR domain-containing protein n=1 Tax=Novosphingobium aquimarinum TaxID=2682494 RepID=UPI001E2EBCEC|nr:SPOR domain-containing protein [Novosphingobium aquimarinum]
MALALVFAAPMVPGALAREVVQPLPSREALRLNAALGTLARDPRNVDALIEAGEAASAMGDPEAALGFFRRADQMSGGNAKVKAGMASAMVLQGNPVAAFPLFDEAIRAGATPVSIAADKALAYDLVGDTARAQAQYAIAAKAEMDDQLRLRMAISQAIGGDAKGSEETLMPLLRKQDKPAWRTRAFTLAILGDTKEAVKISNTILPSELAESVAPYLRYMPRLTPAQQAAAVILGKFPRASEIGRDDAKIAAYQRSMPQRPALAAADKALVPQGQALGNAESRSRNTAKAARTAAKERVAPPDPKPTIERTTGELPPVDDARSTPVRQAAVANTPTQAPTPTPTPAPAPKPAASPAPTPVQRMAQATPAPQPTTTASTPAPAPTNASSPARQIAMAPATSTAGPGFDLAKMPGAATATAAQPAARDIPSPANILDSAEGRPPAPSSTAPAVTQMGTVASATSPSSTGSVATTPVAGAGEKVSLSEVFADLGRPSTQVAPISGAVDMRKIEPARPAPEPDPAEVAAAKAAEAQKAAEAKKAADAKKSAEAKKAKPAPPSHPSRIWVQLGIGRDTKAIEYDWRKWTRSSAALFKGQQPHISEMGRTNRILAGPFDSQKAAKAFLNDAAKEGFSGAFVWTSPAGQVVDKLGKE